MLLRPEDLDYMLKPPFHSFVLADPLHDRSRCLLCIVVALHCRWILLFLLVEDQSKFLKTFSNITAVCVREAMVIQYRSGKYRCLTMYIPYSVHITAASTKPL